MSSHHVTVGGDLVGLLATGSVLTHWYFKHGRKGGASTTKGGGGGGKGRNWIFLAPFAWTFTLGTLCSLAAGGAMGAAAVQIANAGNALGDQLLSSLTGAISPSVTRVGLHLLDPGGSATLILLLLILGSWAAYSSKGVRLRMAMGLIGGCALGPTAGVAGIAGVIVAPLFNTIGDWLVGLL